MRRFSVQQLLSPEGEGAPSGAQPVPAAATPVAPAASPLTSPVAPPPAAATPQAQPAQVPPQQAAPEQPKPHVPASALPDDALKARLDQAKATGQTELLKGLGVASVDELKAAIEAKRVAEEAKRSDAEKLALRDKELEQLRQQVATQEQVNAQLWDAQAAALTPAQVKAVTDLAGDNPSARLRALNTLLPTWATAQPASPAAPAAAAPVPQPAPAANTSPTPAAPTPAGTITPTDHTAVWKGLKQANPVAAARYLVAHQADIPITR